MKKLDIEPKIFHVELTKEEVKLINHLTLEANKSKINNKYEKTNLELYVGTSRLLGIDINNDGTINRTDSF